MTTSISGMLDLNEMIDLIDEPQRSECKRFMEKNRRLICSSKGSATKHQAWPGGYHDHISEVMRICMTLYLGSTAVRPLSFSRSDALFGCFLHDIEKIWKHALLPEDRDYIDKDKLLREEFTLNDDHWNAIHYAHGEGDDYHPTDRIQCPLAAFVHHCDNHSARIWFDKPEPMDRFCSPESEYSRLIRDFYPDEIDKGVAERMLELEQIVFTDQDRQSLVPEEFKL
jgi:hypothetical protein